MNWTRLGYERLSRGFPLSFLTSPATHISQMGTRVFYWGANGEINYGTVQSTNRMADVRKGFGTIGPLLTNRHAGHVPKPISDFCS